MKRWKNIEGTTNGTLSLINGVYYLHNHKEIPLELGEAIAKLMPGKYELDFTLFFRSSGFDDPGSMYGGSDHLGWPPEYEDERIVHSGTITGVMNGEPDIYMTKEIREGLADLLQDEIDEEILDVEEEDKE